MRKSNAPTSSSAGAINLVDALVDPGFPETLSESQAPGQYTRWVFTVNHLQAAAELMLQDHIDDGLCCWIVYGRETAPSTGHYHLQGYCVTNRKYRFKEFKTKFLPGLNPHYEVARAPHEANFKYCSKKSDFVELGERPRFVETNGQREQEDWCEARKKAREGAFDGIRADIAVQHYGNLLKIAANEAPKAEVLVCDEAGLKERFTWIYGPSGSGKTRAARMGALAVNMRVYPKSHNKWWDGFRHDDFVIYDDVADDAQWLGDMIKLWCQQEPFQAETKGGMKQIRPKFMTFTSNMHPFEIFTKSHQQHAIARRLNIKYHGYGDARDDTRPPFEAPQAGTVATFNLPPPPRLERSGPVYKARVPVFKTPSPRPSNPVARQLESAIRDAYANEPVEDETVVLNDRLQVKFMTQPDDAIN